MWSALVIILVFQAYTFYHETNKPDIWELAEIEEKKRNKRMDDLVRSHLKTRLWEIDMTFSEFNDSTWLSGHYFMFWNNVDGDIQIKEGLLLEKADKLLDNLLKREYTELRFTALSKRIYPNLRKTVRGTFWIKKK